MIVSCIETRSWCVIVPTTEEKISRHQVQVYWQEKATQISVPKTYFGYWRSSEKHSRRR